MVGFIPEPSTEEDPNQVPKPKISKDPIDFIEPKTNDLTFADSFLDFDSIKEWFEDNPNLDRIGDIEKSMETGKADVCEASVSGSEPNVDGLKPIVSGSEPVGVNSGCTVKVEEDDSKPEKKLSSSIDEEMGKVCLVSGLEGGSSSSEACDSECSSSSSSSSELESGSELEIGNTSSEESDSSDLSSSSGGNSDDDDDKEEEEEVGNKGKVMVENKREGDGAGELEEGEIGGVDEEMADGRTDNIDEDEEAEEADKILSGFGIEFDEIDEEDDDTGATRGPIRSKNEIEVLPPVPQLDVTLQSHHQMLAVGVVLSIIGAKVIVEGREKHNPLNEGSILWITLNRSPLGLVDEIFGPVTNPYYVVRYNSESEVPDGINEGASISFVPEFANHVLNDKNLHKKGYDASGDNDEELSDDTEFSDDEKEAEYKRTLKMTKRGMNDQRVGNWINNKKKVKSRDGAWKNGRNSAQQTSKTLGQLRPNENRHNIPTVSASLDNQNCSYSLVGGQNFVGGSSFVQPFSIVPYSSGFMTPSNGVWTNGTLGQHQQNPIFPNRFPAEGMTSLSQNYQQHCVPLPTSAAAMPASAIMPYQQQPFNPSLSTLPSAVLPGGQSNLSSGPACAPWLGIAGQNGYSQTSFGVGMQGQQLLSAVQGILATVQAADGNCNVQPERVPDNRGTLQNFNMGNGFSQPTFGIGMQGQQLLSAVQGILANGAMADGNCNVQPEAVPDNFETSQNFNTGASSSRGRKPYHRGRGRGRGRFTGRRGHQQF